MNPLNQIPPKVRSILYWTGYILGVVSSGITAVWGAVAAASPDVSMPLGLVIAQAVVTLLTTQLNLLAGSNMPSFQDVVEDSPVDFGLVIDGHTPEPRVGGEHRAD